ncbi:ribonuclease P protein component [Larkinella arboricola]|uniref:Ribonuclease P protein component n=1 Tax=Larkinella arboricola TaxID=643671 RepID=A0A327WZP7_LARAB|nr:ribonuclease P protein component [Larkinella arboricola]RAJ98050.1 ribonuclease P protein component [Larkinella arboricola]
MKQTFKKSERLCSKKTIGQLFQKGSATTRTFYLFPFRLLYMNDPVWIDPVPSHPDRVNPLPAILISVSSRNFKKAVDRNHIRRRVREAYRLNKSLLFGTPDKPKHPPAYIVFLYTAREKISFEEIEKSMKLALARVTVTQS